MFLVSSALSLNQRVPSRHFCRTCIHLVCRHMCIAKLVHVVQHENSKATCCMNLVSWGSPRGPIEDFEVLLR